jgi:pyruvate/2-oxoglutarate dehydrogenase complex dihydrolipoamide acyltransferase (E2) component
VSNSAELKRRGLEMKQFFAGALLFTCLSLPASASSIIEIDSMVTGPLGSSIVTLGGEVPCEETACVDATGGNSNLKTGSAGQMSSLTALPEKKINFEFARKFPDPAVPVPTPVSDATAVATDPTAVPKAPADSGEIAAQPPVQPQPESPTAAAPTADAAPQGMPADPARGSIDPNAPVKPIVSSELRDGE